MVNKREMTFANYTLGAMFIGAGVFSLIAISAPIVLTSEGLTFTACLGLIGVIMANRAPKHMER